METLTIQNDSIEVSYTVDSTRTNVKKKSLTHYVSFLGSILLIAILLSTIIYTFSLPIKKLMLGDYLIVSCCLVFALRKFVRVSKKFYRKLLSFKASYAQAPWLTDYSWHPNYIIHKEISTAFARFPALLLSITVVVSIYELARDNKEPFGYFIALLFCLLVAYYVKEIITSFKLYKKFGKTTLQYKQLPFYIGKPANFTVELPSKIQKLPYLDCNLSCYEEGWVSHNNGDSNTYYFLTTKTHSISHKIQPDTSIRPGKKLKISFPLDKDLPSSKLDSKNLIYWELSLSCEAAGYKASFLMPIYK